MSRSSIKIEDVITTEYADFLSFCSMSGKVFLSELSNVDYVAFRVASGQSREYVRSIQNLIESIKKDAEISKTEKIDNKTDEEQSLLGEEEDIDADQQELQGDEEEFDALSVDIEEHEYESEDALINEEESEGITISESSVIDELSNKVEEGESTLAEMFDVDPECFNDDSLDVLDLSVRASNCLKSFCVKTKGKTIRCVSIGDLLDRTPEELRSIRNMGIKSVNEIIQKTRDYVSEYRPQKSSGCLYSNEKKTINIDDATKRAITAMLSGEDVFTEKYSEEQIEIINDARSAIDVVGVEMCNEMLINPEYSIAVLNSLMEFAAPSITRINEIREIANKVLELPDTIKTKRAIHFFRAYLTKGGEQVKAISDVFNDEVRICEIPNVLIKYKYKDKDSINSIFKTVGKFVDWISFDIDELIKRVSKTIEEKLSEKSSRTLEVLELRAQGKTLEEVGNEFGVTRERIRQIEAKAHKSFWNTYHKQNYDLIMLVYALRDGDDVLFFEELNHEIGDFSYALWEGIKFSPEHENYYYSKVLDAIVIRTDKKGTQNEQELYALVGSIINNLPDIFEEEHIDVKINSIAEQNNLPIEVLMNAFNKQYKHTGVFYHRGNITVGFMCEYVLKKRFQAGFKIADEYEADRFRQYLSEFFGSKGASITNRALDAKVGYIGVLCDRGKYIHPDYLQIDQEILNAINNYVKESNRSLLPYGEVFEALKDVFEGTQITNRFLLQGALKKYGCEYETGRDFIRKKHAISFVDELESFVEERGIVHKSEIFAEFTSLGEAGLGQVAARSENVFNIDGGYYIHASVFDILPEDYETIRPYISQACAEIPVNIRTVYDEISVRFPDFMYRNDFEDRNKLFAALNYMFREEFSFSRPYIAKNGLNTITNKSVILQHIADYESIEIDELIDICDDNNIHYVAASYLFQLLSPEFVRISNTTMMRRELSGIDEDVINKTVQIVEELVEANGYIVGSKVRDYLWFPETEVEWNEFLLENIIVQSGKIGIINMTGDPLKHSNAIYVSEDYQKDSLTSFLIKILKDEVLKGTFTSKTDMKDWLKEKGLIERKMPNFLESAKYFYVNETGVHCAE